ncbi:hypothetical protein TTHERM_00289020 (macronuclear) [Tetrahymena thermophila SB210]|uniref:Uncharacterized protein n=1 Tax=Tetrahymena thermophila (strain SB210) TaxID=312017 RepID=I7MF28_TETTS|nr:hypothetical protein TTHERM_00289020 [Tetrahymena thermophila SB210]EAR98374.2 hypothetical protein TTHERM_00289020 [Tetrahymena thermophila SB210]|eukprot:XP_001018619.2 hypothetical protein TTHERM_00289020 [Tetrahymena thermophila SB210]
MLLDALLLPICIKDKQRLYSDAQSYIYRYFGQKVKQISQVNRQMIFTSKLSFRVTFQEIKIDRYLIEERVGKFQFYYEMSVKQEVSY